MVILNEIGVEFEAAVMALIDSWEADPKKLYWEEVEVFEKFLGPFGMKGKNVGRGVCATCFPFGENHIIKMNCVGGRGSADGHIEWLKWSVKNQSNKFVPKIKFLWMDSFVNRWDTEQQRWICIQERCESLGILSKVSIGNRLEEFMMDKTSSFYSPSLLDPRWISKMKHDKKDFDFYEQHVKCKTPHERLKSLYRIKDFLHSTESRIDLHARNIMYRPSTMELVLVDPLY